MSAYGYRKPSDLPTEAPIFPLGGAMLFPRHVLPLNIFEPRYLNMVDDALGGNRLIAMIQPMAGDAARPRLAHVGCVGRITSFAETDDGRYVISLTGVCRFDAGAELEFGRPYRTIELDYARFARDLSPQQDSYDRDALEVVLRRYIDVHGFNVDWAVVESVGPEALIHAITALCPFDPAEKQSVLEAVSLSDRAAVVMTLLEMNSHSDDNRSLQ
jgi:hypothetical protein